MNHPAGRLRAIAELATALADQWPAYEQTEAALAVPLMAAAGGGSGRGSDVPDPTFAVFDSSVSPDSPYGETSAEVTEALGHLRLAQRRMEAIRQHHSTVARTIDAARNAARCSGAVDPTCVNNAVRDKGDNAGLCWKCIKRKQRDKAS